MNGNQSGTEVLAKPVIAVRSLEEVLKKSSRTNIKEDIIKYIFMGCALLSIITTLGIVLVLLADAFYFFSEVSIVKFFTGIEWAPTQGAFGVLPIVSGTMTFTFVTSMIALPSGLLAAVFLSEYAKQNIRDILKPAIEILSGIPSVVYGYFALVYITPIFQDVFKTDGNTVAFLNKYAPEFIATGYFNLVKSLDITVSSFNVLSASIVVAIMILPTIASISEDAIRAVPKALREAGYSLGASKFRVIVTIVIPSALSGIVASFILGISRAIGETMAVTLAAGAFAQMINPTEPVNTLFKPIMTMTAAMVEIGISDVTGDSLAYKSLFAVGLTLFIITFSLNVFSQFIKSKYREKYQ